MIVNIKASKSTIRKRWRKFKNVDKLELTEDNCVIVHREDKEVKHYHSSQYSEFYTEEDTQ